MSYISFYRKWRPQRFSEVVGQEHIVKTLQNAISKNMLVHGYMFCGTKGTGKTSVARIFSKAINCDKGTAIEPCNKCDNCISITSGSNVDLIEIDGASNNSVEDIRILREKVTSLPFVLRKKIYIIDEVHMLSKSAFNALLKTLEEPPEHVIFIMATTEPDKVIPTIMSRCQRFDFKPIPVDKIKNRLRDIASAEKIDITDSAAGMVAKYSGGSLRDADGILEQLTSFGDKDKVITVNEVSSILGIIDLEMLFELANIILEKNISQGLLFISRLFSTSFSLNAFNSEFIEHLYNLYIIKNYENPSDLFDMPEEFRDSFYNQAGLFTSEHLSCLIGLFSGLLAQIKESENPKTFFKAAIIKALNTEITERSLVTKNLKKIDLDMQNCKNELAKLQGKKSFEEPVSAQDTAIEAVNPIVPEVSNQGKTDEKLSKITTPGEPEIKKEIKIAGDAGISAGPKPEKTTGTQLPEESKVPDKQVIQNNPDDFSGIILAAWNNLLIKTKDKSVPLHAVLIEVKRFKVYENKAFFFLDSKNNWHKTHLNKQENRTVIQDLLKSLTGTEINITFDLINDENKNQSIDIANIARKSNSSGDFLKGNENDYTGNEELDTFSYFEEKFRLKEK